MDADEIFSTGNYSKVVPVNRIEDRELQPGPVYHEAREAYTGLRPRGRLSRPSPGGFSDRAGHVSAGGSSPAH